MNRNLSVLAVVVSVVVCLLAACHSGERQRLQLEELERQNRADSLMLNDSLARDLADYFDRHGTPNEQMRAYYILGRTYADRGEAPAALDAYHEAISRADTTSQDCDFAKLSRVYGQSATIFYQQGLYRNALEYQDLCSDYGYRGRDTLNALRSYAMKAAAYEKLQMADSAIYFYKNAIRLFQTYHFDIIASGFAGGLAEILIDKGETVEAEPYMHDYEQHSGYFDSAGNITKGREVYYYAKGLYYLKKNNLDSAEYYFRKELNTAKDFNNQNGGANGLGLLFQQTHKPDSAAKYFAYSYAMNDSMYALKATHEVEQAMAMYDYTRQQEIAQKEREKSAYLKYYLLLSILFIVIVLFVSVVISINISHKKKMQEKEVERLRTDYSDAVAKKEQIAKELEMLRINHERLKVSEQESKNLIETVKTNNSQLLRTKEKEIAELNEKIRKYAIRLLNSPKMISDNPQFALLIEDFHRKAIRKKNTSLPQRADWDQLIRLFAQKQPEAYVAIGREQTLSSQELRACILLLLKFTNGEIISLLDITSQGMTNIRTRINEKLFRESKASTLDFRLKEIPIV